MPGAAAGEPRKEANQRGRRLTVCHAQDVARERKAREEAESVLADTTRVRGRSQPNVLLCRQDTAG